MHDKQRKHYLTAPQVCERYGDRSAMWLWRKMKFSPATSGDRGSSIFRRRRARSIRPRIKNGGAQCDGLLKTETPRGRTGASEELDLRHSGTT